MSEYVRIPTSELGRDGRVGRVVARWAGMIAVDFDGALGHYTVANHTILPA